MATDLEEIKDLICERNSKLDAIANHLIQLRTAQAVSDERWVAHWKRHDDIPCKDHQRKIETIEKTISEARGVGRGMVAVITVSAGTIGGLIGLIGKLF